MRSMMCRTSASDLAFSSKAFPSSPWALPVVNVCQQYVPAGNTTFRISRGEGARLKPAVHTVGAPLAEFKIMRLPGFEPALIYVDHARKVIRRDSLEVGRIFPFLDRLAEIFQGLTVEKLDLACGTQGKHKSRNAIDDQPKAFLTLPERFLVALALNCNRREMCNLPDDFLILLAWPARFAPIDRKGAQYKAVRRQYRGRPARFQTVL